MKKGTKVRRYDWDKWFERKSRKFTLKKGKDYGCLTSTMIFQVRNEGAKRDLTISIDAKKVEEDGTIQVSFRDREYDDE